MGYDEFPERPPSRDAGLDESGWIRKVVGLKGFFGTPQP